MSTAFHLQLAYLEFWLFIISPVLAIFGIYAICAAHDSIRRKLKPARVRYFITMALWVLSLRRDWRRRFPDAARTFPPLLKHLMIVWRNTGDTQP